MKSLLLDIEKIGEHLTEMLEMPLLLQKSETIPPKPSKAFDGNAPTHVACHLRSAGICRYSITIELLQAALPSHALLAQATLVGQVQQHKLQQQIAICQGIERV